MQALSVEGRSKGAGTYVRAGAAFPAAGLPRAPRPQTAEEPAPALCLAAGSGRPCRTLGHVSHEGLVLRSSDSCSASGEDTPPLCPGVSCPARRERGSGRQVLPRASSHAHARRCEAGARNPLVVQPGSVPWELVLVPRHRDHLTGVHKVRHQGPRRGSV